MNLFSKAALLMDVDRQVQAHAHDSESEVACNLDGSDDRSNSASMTTQLQANIDLVGGPFAVIESDPGEFQFLLFDE